MQTKARIRFNAPFLLALFCLFLVMEILDPSRIWVILIVVMGGALLIGFVWVRSLARGLRFKREMRFGWAQVGDRLEERFSIENEGWAPSIWLEIKDQSTLPEYRSSLVTGIDGHSNSEWRTRVTCTRRGLYVIGPTVLQSSDPLGIFTVDFINPASRAILVMPPVVSLPAIEIAPGGRSGAGRPRANAPERTVSVSSVREYMPGDSLHWVHWPTSARRGEFFVRIFDGTPIGDWRIILDLEQSVQVGTGWDSTEEHGVILAASLVDRGLRSRRSVGLTINGREFSWLVSHQGENYRWEALRALALAHPGETSLKELLQQVDANIRSQSSLVLITAATHGEWIEALLPIIWRGVAPTVLLLDPNSFQPAEKISSSAPTVNQAAAQMAFYGIRHYVITRDLLDRPEARPGESGKWEWRVTPRGRAIAAKVSSDTDWKMLA